MTLALVLAIPLTLLSTRVLSVSALSGRMAAAAVRCCARRCAGC